uniref:Uncharacterized protein n=1 Tax=Tanacetum cinerariifolium TaxID=118510 RepID=A0A6L2LLS3_TANCI|nr:hypothetical protein [Tanacetum cinerariifolium]
MEASLVVTQSSRTESENSSLETTFNRSKNENRSSDKESTSLGNDSAADIRPSYDCDTMTEAHHSNNDTFDNTFGHGIQNHEQPESIPNTYMVNENNSNIIYDIPNIDQGRDKEEHDYVDYEQQRAFFASLINNLKCDVEKYNEVNREAQQANALLTNELERYKEKQKHFLKDKTIESEIGKEKILFGTETSRFETYFGKLENVRVVLERQFDRKIQDSKARRDQFLKQIASLESKFASQDLISNQKEYNELRISYNALKAKFDVRSLEKGKSHMSNFSTPKISVSPKIYMGESSKSFPKRVSQFTTYSLQKDRKFSKKPQAFETPTPQKLFNSSE